MEAQDLYNNNSILNGSSMFNNHTLDYNSTHPIPTNDYSSENSSNYNMFNPSAGYGGIFFVAATAIFMVACLYMIIFLVILRFGTFVPIYDARFFRGRIYLCYGQRPCFGIFGTCNWCFVPLCMYFLLNPVREDDNFNRAQEGGGLSREERREALQELLKPMVFVVRRSGPTSPTSVVVEENDNRAAACGDKLHGETVVSFGKESTAPETIIMDGDDSNNLFSSTRARDPQEEAGLEPGMCEDDPPLSQNPSSSQTNQASAEKLEEHDALFSAVSMFSPPNNHSTDRGQQDDNADSIMSSSVHSSGSDPDPVCSICLSEYGEIHQHHMGYFTQIDILIKISFFLSFFSFQKMVLFVFSQILVVIDSTEIAFLNGLKFKTILNVHVVEMTLLPISK